MHVTNATDICGIIGKACHYLYDIQDLLDLFYRNGKINMVASTLYALTGPTAEDGKEATFEKAYISFGAFGVIFQWRKDGMQQNADELKDIIFGIWKDIIREDVYVK